MTTQIAACRNVGSAYRRLAAWIARAQRGFSGRVHAGGDAFACQHGWAITTTTGRFGFGGRVYRDPRFGQRAAATSCGEPPSGPAPGRSR